MIHANAPFEVRMQLRLLGYAPKVRSDLVVRYEHLILTNAENRIGSIQTARQIAYLESLPHRFPRHIRIWIWFKGGPVRISLKDGQSVTFGYCEPHEEGFSGESVTISRHGFELTRDWSNFGRDCDGPLSHDGVQTWNAATGEYRPWPWDVADTGDIRFPKWEEYEPTRVTDAFAEAMGY